jgi:glycosyltransferase involved in cell wall biosynthesis
MKISLFMDKFPSFPETYVLWHIAELVRAGQDVTLYPAHADWQAERVQPEVEELGLLSRIVTPPGQPATTRAERVEEVTGAQQRAAYRQPAALLKALPMSREGGGMNMVQVLRHLGALPPLPDVTVSHAYFAPPGRRAQMLRDAMAQAHVGLFPGVRTSDGAEEALGGAVLEAQAAGLPVIASDAGGVMEGFDPGRTGLLVPQADADAIADAIAALMADPEQLTRMGQAGRAFIAERFDSEQLNTRWLHLYAELAAGRLPSQHTLYPFDTAPGDAP